jgi:DNA-binding LacI/PurR family transcriptional regulator
VTLGYITADLNNGCSFALWQGVKDACGQKGIHVLFFSAGEYKSPQVGNFMKNVALDFIKKELIDGLIVNVATLFHYVGEDEITAFFREYRRFPTVNIGFEIENYPRSWWTTRRRSRTASLISQGTTGIKKSRSSRGRITI